MAFKTSFKTRIQSHRHSSYSLSPWYPRAVEILARNPWILSVFPFPALNGTDYQYPQKAFHFSNFLLACFVFFSLRLKVSGFSWMENNTKGEVLEQIWLRHTLHFIDCTNTVICIQCRSKHIYRPTYYPRKKCRYFPPPTHTHTHTHKIYNNDNDNNNYNYNNSKIVSLLK